MNWKAISLFSLLQALLLAIWVTMELWDLLGKSLPLHLAVLILAYLFPVVMIGVKAKSHFFLQGFLVAVFGSVLGFFVMLFFSILFQPPGFYYYAYWAAHAEIFFTVIALLLSPIAGLFSLSVEMIRKYMRK